MACLLIYAAIRLDYLGLVACLLFGVGVASRILSKSSLRGHRATLRTQTHRSQSGQAVSCALTLRNQNRILPLFYPVATIRESETARAQRFQYQGVIAPGQSATVTIAPQINTRGRQRLHLTAVQSSFPFALHQSTHTSSEQTNTLIVWPRPEPLDLDRILQVPARQRFSQEGRENNLPQGVSASRIRDYQTGDPRSSINWKLTAKRDKTTIIESRDTDRERYELHLDATQKNWPRGIQFERMIGLVSTLVSELSRRSLLQGIFIGDRYFSFNNPKDQKRFFDALAVLQATSEAATKEPSGTKRQLWILPDDANGIQLSDTPQLPSRKAAP